MTAAWRGFRGGVVVLGRESGMNTVNLPRSGENARGFSGLGGGFDEAWFHGGDCFWLVVGMHLRERTELPTG